MSVWHCWKCEDTGEDLGNFCTCSLGRKLAQEERSPVWPGSVLVDAAESNHRDKIRAEGKVTCWNCDLQYQAHEIKGHTCNNCYADPSYPRKLAMGLVK